VPRKYSMEMRTAAVEETRRRIIDATVQLHNEHGVSATSMQDIADRAGVALATVYRHFPSLDDLVPACGGRNLEMNPPPTASVFERLDSGDDRVRALVQALFTHYERGVRPYEVGFAEAVTLPVMAGLMNELGAHVEGLVTGAIAPFNPDRALHALAVGLCDFRVWRSLTEAGLSSAAAAESVTRLIVTALSTQGETKGG
jgi:AcrR family transcriptional regulator